MNFHLELRITPGHASLVRCLLGGDVSIGCLNALSMLKVAFRPPYWAGKGGGCRCKETQTDTAETPGRREN